MYTISRTFLRETDWNKWWIHRILSVFINIKFCSLQILMVPSEVWCSWTLTHCRKASGNLIHLQLQLFWIFMFIIKLFICRMCWPSFEDLRETERQWFPVTRFLGSSSFFKFALGSWGILCYLLCICTSFWFSLIRRSPQMWFLPT